MKQRAEQLWAASKYEVMYHSQKYYNDIRQLMRTKPTYEEVAQQIEAAKQMSPTNGSVRNSCDHMWGYFKRHATEEEKQQYANLKEKEQFEQMRLFIYELATKYEVTYLQQSTILTKK